MSEKDTIVIFVNGAPRSGKDTAIRAIDLTLMNEGPYSRPVVTNVDHHTETSGYSSIDTVRDACKAMGIDVSNKTPADRKLLSVIGNAVEEHSMHRSRSCVSNVLDTVNRAYNSGGFNVQDDVVCFLHVREEYLIDRITEMLKESISEERLKVLRLKIEGGYDPNALSKVGNASDDSVNEIEYDYTITNDSSLSDLYERCRIFVETLFED